METPVEFLQALIQPDRQIGSRYHKHLTKDLAISNLKNERHVRVITLHFDLISMAQSQGWTEVAQFFSAKMGAYLNAMRSLEGFERQQQNTTVMRQVMKTEGDKKSNWQR